MKSESIIKEIWSWVKALLLAFIIALLVNAYLLQPYRVKGQSMMPNFHDRDYTMVWKATGHYEYGDVVIIDHRVDRPRKWTDNFTEHPVLEQVQGEEDQGNLWIKRVIGKPGDVLELRSNKLYRNGQLLNEPYINEAMTTNPDQKIDVPAGHVFVMGDNRNHSSDSRVIGPVPIDHVLGKVVFHR